MVEPIKWGVLGNANIARVCVIPAIQKSSNGTVRALATRSPANAEKVATQHKIGQIYDEYERLLADPDIQVIYNPLPNHLHFPWTIKALRAGKHVLCEKPLACNAHEAKEMAATAKSMGLMLMEAFMYRFHPRSIRVKEMVAQGSVGKPYLVRSAFCFHMNKKLRADGQGARLNPEMGGGALLDVGCYSVSVARWLFGKEPTHLQGQAVYHSGGADVHFVGSLKFPEDGLATFEASFITALQQTYTIVGNKGAIELPHDAFIPWEKDAVFTLRKQDEEFGEQISIPGADEYQLMVEHFADAILGKEALGYSAQDSIMNMRALDALAEASRTGRMIAL
jgi:predicted dehydrogenase